MIDKSGHINFTIEIDHYLKILDDVVIVVCVVSGIETKIETSIYKQDR